MRADELSRGLRSRYGQGTPGNRSDLRGSAALYGRTFLRSRARCDADEALTLVHGNSLGFRGVSGASYYVNVRSCEGFRMPAHDGDATYTGAGVRKPPKEETAGRDTSDGAACAIEDGVARNFDS